MIPYAHLHFIFTLTFPSLIPTLLNLLSTSLDLPFLKISNKWNNKILGLWGLTSFTKHVFEVHPCGSKFFFIAKYFMSWALHCVYPFISWWTLGCFYFGAIINSAAMNMCGQVFRWHMFWFLLGQHLGVELQGFVVNLCITF